MSVQREEAQAFVERFEKAGPSELDALYRELSGMTGVAVQELRKSLDPREQSTAYLVERIRAFQSGDLKRDRAALTTLVRRLTDEVLSEAQRDELLRIVVANVPAPRSYIIELIFGAFEAPSAEEVVEKGLAYQVPEGIPLGPGTGQRDSQS
jgi:hypothetical protein